MLSLPKPKSFAPGIIDKCIYFTIKIKFYKIRAYKLVRPFSSAQICPYIFVRTFFHKEF